MAHVDHYPARASQLQDAEAAGRICSVPHDPGLQVHTAWDLGIADSTVVWFIQQLGGPGGEVRVIDVVKGEGVALDVGGYRDAPPGLRVWCGATVDTADIEALTPWLDWAYRAAMAERAAA